MMTYFNILGSQQYYKLIGASRWKHKVVYEEEELRSKYKEVSSYKTASWYIPFASRRFQFAQQGKTDFSKCVLQNIPNL